MPTPNKLFDPAADAVHDRHAAERERLGRLLFDSKRCSVSGNAYTKLHARWEEHHLECLETFKTRLATVEEYAAWKFGYRPKDSELPPDLDRLVSVADVDRLYSLLYQPEHWAAASLPVGQPCGMGAFDSPDLQFWRHFKADELVLGHYVDGGARVLVTVSRRDGLWHVCFMQDWLHEGVEVALAFEDLATSFYQHALVQADLHRATRGGLRGWLGRVLPPRFRARALRPSSFRFYEHLPPQWMIRERFSLVTMRFRHGRFRELQRTGLDAVPQVLAAVRYETSADPSPTVAIPAFRGTR